MGCASSRTGRVFGDLSDDVGFGPEVGAVKGAGEAISSHRDDKDALNSGNLLLKTTSWRGSRKNRGDYRSRWDKDVDEGAESRDYTNERRGEGRQRSMLKNKCNQTPNTDSFVRWARRKELPVADSSQPPKPGCQIVLSTKHVSEIRETLKIDRTVQVDSLRSKAIDINAVAQKTVSELGVAFSQATSALNRESNFGTAFSRALPKEIQADILLQYAKSFDEESFYGGYLHAHENWRHIPRISNWADIMLVCSSWYHIIRTDPRFWTSISFAWPRSKIQTYLTLSKQARLHLALPTANPFILHKSELLMTHVHRAQEIELHPQVRPVRAGVILNSYPWGNNVPEISPVWQFMSDIIDQKLAPSLTHLMIEDHNSIYTLPSIMSFSTLSILELKGCFLRGPWAETFPASLRKIHIFRSDIHADLHDLLNLLRRCAMLEMLIFSWNEVSPREHGESIARTDQSICVKHLRGLEIWHSEKHKMEQFFDSCTFHRLSSLKIYIQHPLSTPPFVPSYFSERMARTTSMKLRVTDISIGTTFADPSSPDVQYFLDVIFYREQKSAPEWHTNFNEVIHHFTNLTHLMFHQPRYGDHGSLRCAWPSLVSVFRSITILEVGGCIDEEMFMILGSRTRKGPDTVSEMPLPCLVYLRLEDDQAHPDRFYRPLTEEEEEESLASPEDVSRSKKAKHRYELLLTCLSNRMAAERGIDNWEVNSERVERYVDTFEIDETVINWYASLPSSNTGGSGQSGLKSKKCGWNLCLNEKKRLQANDFWKAGSATSAGTRLKRTLPFTNTTLNAPSSSAPKIENDLENESPSVFMDELVSRAGNIGAQALDETIEKLLDALQLASKRVADVRAAVQIDRSAEALRAKAMEIHATCQMTLASFDTVKAMINRKSNFDTTFARTLPREIQTDILHQCAESELSPREQHHHRKTGEQYFQSANWVPVMLVCSPWLPIIRTNA
ncbi:hypothetical protein SISNIDRAFT_463988 [Sistotremastrum niveocremeum HHB9708]|uniref:Uncharacterized protein n=1 Tax=Sistotremastrum niveocremeum HHB9708 TaxID=1314777 RepID=A0A164Y2E9_9AGAM|nr:hypothetical protein SISNIDRAFT_463988 [Sistotremastrum niveocremeum HHB9708]